MKMEKIEDKECEEGGWDQNLNYFELLLLGSQLPITHILKMAFYLMNIHEGVKERISPLFHSRYRCRYSLYIYSMRGKDEHEDEKVIWRGRRRRKSYKKDGFLLE